MKLARPTKVGQLKTFLGALTWIGEHFPQVRAKVKHLDCLNGLEKTRGFIWCADHELEFQQVRELIGPGGTLLVNFDKTQGPVLWFFDASNGALGVTAIQRHGILLMDSRNAGTSTVENQSTWLELEAIKSLGARHMPMFDGAGEHRFHRPYAPSRTSWGQAACSGRTAGAQVGKSNFTTRLRGHQIRPRAGQWDGGLALEVEPVAW